MPAKRPLNLLGKIEGLNFRGGENMKFGKISIPFLIQLILFSFVIFIFLKITELPLKGEVDYLTQMGVVKLDQKTDAPNFVLPDLEGRKRTLRDFQGKFVMLNFWATW